MLPVLIVLGLITALIALLTYLYRRPLPQVNGTLKVSGLSAPAEIIRDRWGVPHIYAQNQDDLLFAQGYVHAQDRLWQMELNRRIGHGRLAEMFGEIAFTTDRFLRTIGLSRAARADAACTDAETRRAFEAYARGVNAYAQHNPLPLEFTLLGTKPEPWTPVDSLVWVKVMALGLSSNWDSKLLHAALIAKLGAERAAQLQGEYPRDNPLILTEQTFAEIIGRVLEQFRAAGKWFPVSGMGGMSNNWVVDGTKSATGKPLLANDPHLSLQMPSIWYENHLVSPELEVIGVSFPGIPGVIIGHNANIAWGFTNAFPDVQDLYIERFNPDDPVQYEHRGAWEKATIVREEIRVKGDKTPRVAEVIITRHGPIISELIPPTVTLRVDNEKQKFALALRWVAHDESHIQRALLGMNRARNWDEFANTLRDWSAPSQNMVYADRAGNIGYYMPGRIPIRAKGMGVAPVPGWTGEYEWIGCIPHEELPHAFNPTQHYLASANNQVVGKEYPHFLTAETMNGFRARRIVEMLTEKEKLSADDFARMHVDLYCAPARPFCELLTALSANILAQPALGNIQNHAKQALDAVKRWDYNLTADSVAGALFELMQYFAMRRVFGPWLGDLTDHYLGVGFHPLLLPMVGGYMDRSLLILQRMLVNDEHEWFKDVDGKALTREEILALALSDAIGYLRKAIGEDVSQWQWGKVHLAAFNHTLGAQKPLDKIFNRGPYPYGGDTNTVWQAAYVPKLPIQSEGGFTASWRQILDPSDWDASRAVHTTGQSGHPASKHYDDMIPLWLKGEYHPLLWTREKVEAHAEARLRLEP
jgi:penicillin amidase